MLQLKGERGNLTGMKKTLKNPSIPGGIVRGVLCAITVILLLSVICAKAVQLQWVEENHIRYMVMVILFLSAWLGAAISYRKIQQQKPMVCLMFALAFFAVLLGTNMLFFDGRLSGAGETGLLVAGGSFLNIFIHSGNKKRKNYRNRKRHNR